MGLFRKTVGQYSASAYEIARNLLRSRDTQRERADRLQGQLDEQVQINDQLQREYRRLDDELRSAQQQRDRAQQDVQQLRDQPVVLPDDPPLLHHTYGARMISLCIQLAKKVGLRASMEALKVVFDWLAIHTKIPCWTSVRTWLCRMGIDEINHSLEAHDDWIWMADHSNQIGKEKVLTILGIRACDLPPPGQTLGHNDVRVLAVVPGTQWKREDVAEQYEVLARKIGMPKMLLTDGAVELRESAHVLENEGKKPILLRDLKHFAANALEHMIGPSEPFKMYLSLLGSTRSSIQQTELSHFTPPAQKPKARFMNLAATLRWGEMVLWHLDHADSKARQGIDAERMNAKLGWLSDYRSEIAQWRRLDALISTSLGFINTHGIYHGASSELQSQLDALLQASGVDCEQSKRMSRTLIEFVLESENQLSTNDRGWLSTEILESAFGLYKALEGQHSKSGFTSLLASFGALLKKCSPDEVRQGMRRTPVKELQEWVSTNLGKTLTSKKLSAYRKTLDSVTGS